MSRRNTYESEQVILFLLARLDVAHIRHAHRQIAQEEAKGELSKNECGRNISHRPSRWNAKANNHVAVLCTHIAHAESPEGILGVILGNGTGGADPAQNEQQDLAPEFVRQFAYESARQGHADEGAERDEIRGRIEAEGLGAVEGVGVRPGHAHDGEVRVQHLEV